MRSLITVTFQHSKKARFTECSGHEVDSFVGRIPSTRPPPVRRLLPCPDLHAILDAMNKGSQSNQRTCLGSGSLKGDTRSRLGLPTSRLAGFTPGEQHHA